ncbi:hypothetical protein L1987_44442 [Smallanthus sonchifolius]|uniref:Uncharacterized protein n=1 Tax=Smallanthus sonchifolius TaxID=185202 RepID=A0ACB9GQH8_9ASTR|nr:hypothetical protein L1987_44442 [Smallanthus sonchifolius]
MEARNSGAESQTSDQSQPILELDGQGGSNMVGDPADVAGGGEGTEVELGNGGGGADTVKKKRGRPPRAQAAKAPPAKMNKEEDEDVCFICFDGGSLVLCDRRGCPKAYHPACVKRDEAFFRSKAKWNCGWHICSSCQKAAHHMCYTCTYSLCKGCIKKADYICVRGDKGFCMVCMKMIMLIENGGQEKDEKAQVDFDDKTSWEYLFKVYWIYLKGKLSLTLDELTQAKSPQTEASITTSVIPSTRVHNGDNDLKNIPSDTSENLEAVESKKRKTDEQISIVPHKESVITKKPGTEGRSSVIALKDWATKELLDFVAHMKNGDTSVLSQFDVQELMLEYIKRNNLRDPRKKSQIVCDSRLKILFGKPRVGHFEMLKLLEFHFFINEDLPKNTVKSIAKQVDPDWNIDNMVIVGKEKKRRNHKKTEERAPQNKLDEYAAIDVHNMNLIYLRRKLMENLIEDSESFQRKVVGSIVRIRISGSDQKHDMYRLVQVVGTSKADKPYKIGNKSADIVLEVLNLDKKETVSIDTISNQDLSEVTLGEIQDKAVSLQSARINDKLQLLKTPEERERRLREIPEVHSDPKMNPDYETDDTEEYFNKEQGENTKPKYTGISRKNTSSMKKAKDFPNNVNSRSWKNEEGLTSTKATVRINMKKDAHRPSSSGQPQSQVNIKTTTDKIGIRVEGLTVRTTSLSFTQKSVNHEKLSDTHGSTVQSSVQNWIANGTTNTPSFGRSNESNTTDLASPTPAGNGADTNNVSVFDIANADLVDLPSPTPKETTTHVDEKVQNAVVKEAGNVGGAQLPETDKEWTGYSPTDRVVTTSANMEQAIPSSSPPSSQPGYNSLPAWQGVRETIEFSTLAEESVSDLLAEVDAMESQNGFPSPTSRRNNFVEDLFNGSFEEFSPTPIQGSRTDAFSSNGAEIHLPFQPPATATTTTAANTTTVGTSQGNNNNVFDFVKSSIDLQFKWPEMPRETISKDMIDVNNSIKADEQERETNASETSHVQAGGSNEHNKGEHTEPTTTKSKDPSPELVLQFRTDHKEAGDGTVQPATVDTVGPPPPPQPPESLPLPQPVAVGLDKVHPRHSNINFGRPAHEIMTQATPHLNMGRGVTVGWDPHQQTYGGERFNINSPRERSYRVEDSGYSRNSKPWVRQSSFGSGGSGNGGGGYSRAPPKGQRVCRFYESGRCKKGASCNYWHP